MMHVTKIKTKIYIPQVCCHLLFKASSVVPSVVHALFCHFPNLYKQLCVGLQEMVEIKKSRHCPTPQNWGFFCKFFLIVKVLIQYTSYVCPFLSLGHSPIATEKKIDNLRILFLNPIIPFPGHEVLLIFLANIFLDISLSLPNTVCICMLELCFSITS